MGGSPLLALAEKERIVDSLQDQTDEALTELYERLRRQERDLLGLYTKEGPVVRRLYEALARGELEDTYDWQGARAIAEDTRYRLLPYIALRAHLLQGCPRVGLEPESLTKAEAYLKAMREDQDLAAWGWNGQGILLADHLKRYEEAEQAYRQAIALDPQDALTWTNLGLLYHHQLKRLEAAESAYWQALSIDRDDSQAQGRLRALAEEWLAKDPNRAEALARRLTTAFPEDAAAWLLLARALAPRADWPEVRHALGRWLTLLVEQDEDFRDPWRLAGAIEVFAQLVQAGQTAEALGLLSATGAQERWRPLFEALKAQAAGSADYLSRIAPEVRGAAADIYARLTAGAPPRE